MFFFFKQKTAYELRISDWSSDVCSSDLASLKPPERSEKHRLAATERDVVGLLDLRVGRVLLPLVPTISGHYCAAGRSEARRVGTECVSTCRSRWSPYH